MNLILATVGFLSIFVLQPYVIVKVWNKLWQTLEDETFKNMYGALYQGQRTRNRLIGIYHTVYFFRRIIFVSTGLFCRIKDFEGLQWVVVMNGVVIFPSIVIVKLKINVSREMNYFELYCEWTAGIAMIISCCFSEWQTHESRMMIGWYFNLYTLLTLSVTVCKMIYSTYVDVRLWFKQQYTRYLHKKKLEAAP